MPTAQAHKPGPVQVTLLVVLALAPIWWIGIARQAFWTPDEPREADIAWRMTFQANPAVPELAGAPILEKPPLYYWVAGATMAALGLHPWSARLPNLAYATLATAALIVLAFRVAGPTGAWVAGLTAGSFLLSWQVTIWLATDAALVAAVSVALLAAFMGLHSLGGRKKLSWYLLMHAAIALGFMAKSAIALIVPVLTLLTVATWERRWRELLRWELWAGSVLQLALVVPWILEVLRGAHGEEQLLTFFWWNLVGRFVHLQAPAGLDFSTGHRNWPGKYLLEAPFYLLPWTFVVAAALRRAWSAVREPTLTGSAWRFAAAAIVPTLLLLSVSTTARSIYFAPLLPPVALMLGLWASERAAHPDPFEAKMLHWTVWLAAALVILGLLALPMMAAAAAQPPWRTGLLVITGSAVSAAMLCDSYRSLKRNSTLHAISSIYIAVACWLCANGAAYFPVIDRQHDLEAMARAIASQLGGRELVLYRPDETTLAFVDMAGSLRHIAPVASNAATLRGLLAQAPDARALMMLEDRAPGPLSEWLQKHGMQARAENSPATLDAALCADGLAIEGAYALPDGRGYALLKLDPHCCAPRP